MFVNVNDIASRHKTVHKHSMHRPISYGASFFLEPITFPGSHKICWRMKNIRYLQPQQKNINDSCRLISLNLNSFTY